MGYTYLHAQQLMVCDQQELEIARIISKVTRFMGQWESWMKDLSYPEHNISAMRKILETSPQNN